MIHTTLVVMAAGLASRYGGNKQTEGMGPHGEILMEYSICDAIRAGFDKVVFVIRPEMLDRMRALCGDRISRKIEVRYAFQDFSSLPADVALSPDRTKPLGTVHAVLCTREHISEPFAVINADDYYGVDAFQKMHDRLVRIDSAGSAAMVGYELKNTVSRNGSVTRGVCRCVDGRLSGVREVQQIRLLEDGSIVNSSAEIPEILNPDALVSMNFWGFSEKIFDEMDVEFNRFLHGMDPADLKAEYQLPVMVDRLIAFGKLQVDVLRTSAIWFGVTYKEDRPFVEDALRQLHAQGVYPDQLIG